MNGNRYEHFRLYFSTSLLRTAVYVCLPVAITVLRSTLHPVIIDVLDPQVAL